MDAGEWPQAVIEFADWPSAEQVAVNRLRPELVTALANGVICRWWFIRKAPCWRLRYLPADPRARRHLAGILDRLTADGALTEWTAGIYEPETLAFGGPAAMDVAHELFHHDSRNLLNHLARQHTATPGTVGLGRRELGILLCSTLFRGAGQDLYEQGDVWAKVALYRHAAPGLTAEHRNRLGPAVQRLMTVDTSPTSTLVDGGPLAPLADWTAAFERAGQQLAELTRHGRLERGLRAVLAHHVIFAWNRLGMSHTEQSTLTELAKEVVMGSRNGTAFSAASTSLSEVKTPITEESSASAEHLRNALADHLRDQGTLRTGRVDAAVRAVARHKFVPTVPLEEAYADTPVYTKHDESGASISAASQPTVVTMMLEQLQVEPGQRILELGAGTGYNAALLAYLAGEDGQVTTIDVDADIVDGARSGLAAAGVEGVRVILGDGALGYADGAPYDRVIATVGAHGIPEQWLEQLAPTGRLVVPLRLRGSVSRSIVFELDPHGRWRSLSSAMCTFMPLRGIADDARHTIALTSDGAVALQTNQEQAVDPAALAGVLDQPRSQKQTGVKFRGPESPEWMELWLTCAMPGALSRMTVQQSAIDSGLVTTPYSWGSMAVAENNNLAYLTRRPVERASDGGQLHEFGVTGHGPGGKELASRVTDAIRTWDRDYRSRNVRFEIQATNAKPPEPTPGRFAFDTPLNRIVIEWQ